MPARLLAPTRPRSPASRFQRRTAARSAAMTVAGRFVPGRTPGVRYGSMPSRRFLTIRVTRSRWLRSSFAKSCGRNRCTRVLRGQKRLPSRSPIAQPKANATDIGGAWCSVLTTSTTSGVLGAASRSPRSGARSAEQMATYGGKNEQPNAEQDAGNLLESGETCVRIELCRDHSRLPSVDARR